MKLLSNQTVTQFGYDNQGIINYSFNSEGFRSTEFDLNSNKLVVIGNSISFGIGVDESETFAKMLSMSMKKNLHNMSFGCYFHENHDHLANLKNISDSQGDDIFLVQINNLGRRRISKTEVVQENSKSYCVKKFIDYFDTVEQLLKNKSRIYLYWDNIDYDLPESITRQFTIHNQFHIDQSLKTNSTTFGKKTHQVIYKVLYSLLNSQRVADKLIS